MKNTTRQRCEGGHKAMVGNVQRRFSTCIVGLIVIAVSGCAGIRLTDLERDILEEVFFNLHQVDVHLNAMRLLETDEAYSQQIAQVAADYEQLVNGMPALLPDGSQELPRRVNMTEDEMESIVKHAFPNSRKILKSAQQLNDAMARRLLEQIAGNAEFIWSIQDSELVKYRHTETFAVAHNAFVSARRNYPDISIPQAVRHAEQMLVFNEQTRTLQASPLEESVPDVVTTAEYLARSHKIYEKILFHYLAGKGNSPVSLDAIAPSDQSPDAPPAGDSLGVRILSAIDDTFGIVETVPEQRHEQRHIVHFRRGGYSLSHLSKAEREALNAAIRQFVEKLEKTEPEQSFIITLTTIGYSDATPLRESNRFVKNFVRSLEESGQTLPQEQPARKHALNKSFSRLRALVVQEQVKLLLGDFMKKRQVTLQSEALGMGEELPEGLEAPYTDEDRRLCVVVLSVQ